jgi:inner membrane protein
LASAFGHAAVALALSPWFARPGVPRRIWIAGALCAVIPDADVVGFRAGIPYEHMLGHRGLSHSVFSAALVASAMTWFFRGKEVVLSGTALWVYFFLATASHGILDMLTNGGYGVAFFAPLDATRYFLPVQPIQVSPIGIRRFFTAAGWAVLRNELIWVGIPALVLAATGRRWRARSTRTSAAAG